MATPDITPQTPGSGFRLSGRVMLGVLALLAPLAYLFGRVSAGALAGSYLAFLGSGVAAGALGVMIGIPVGLFFGTLRPEPARHAAAAPNTLQMERDILEQIRAELAEDKALFDARRGSTTLFARIDYLTQFWTSVKASGRLFVMQDARLLGVIATAYYWLDQATHLETLAYEAKYAPSSSAGPGNPEQLIAEARLLDGQLDSSLTTAIAAIDGKFAQRAK